MADIVCGRFCRCSSKVIFHYLLREKSSFIIWTFSLL